jgi:hypothetical protein
MMTHLISLSYATQLKKAGNGPQTHQTVHHENNLDACPALTLTLYAPVRPPAPTFSDLL